MTRHYEKQAHEFLFMSAPDDYIRSVFREHFDPKKGVTEEQFMQYVWKLRDNEPDFLEPLGRGHGQLHMMFTGGTLDVARIMSDYTGSYLFTDLKVRWEMIKEERSKMTSSTQHWSPFAKAVQAAEFSFLNNVDINTALAIREEDHLAGVRRVMRKAWEVTNELEEFDDRRSLLLAEEFEHEIDEAEAEWDEIRASFKQMQFAGSATGLLAAGPLIAEGHGEWLAAAAMLATVGQGLSAAMKKVAYKKRFPASFFIDLRS